MVRATNQHLGLVECKWLNEGIKEKSSNSCEKGVTLGVTLPAE